MQVDRYTKSMLTVIAGCLILLVLKTYDIVPDAHAADVTRVHLVDSDPYALYYAGPIEVREYP